MDADKESGALKAYGSLMRDRRRRSGMSLRAAALAAKVDKNTILRLEAGLPIRERSRLQICNAYGIFDVKPESERHIEFGEHFARSLESSGPWHRAKLRSPHEPSQVNTAAEYGNPQERMRQGRLGFANQFFARIDAFRERSNMRAGLFEVFGPSGYSEQKSGEAFVYVLRGALTFTVGEESFTVTEGQGATFDRNIVHMHEPAAGITPDQLPCIMLYVQCE